jgi:hypothetical protein
MVMKNGKLYDDCLGLRAYFGAGDRRIFTALFWLALVHLVFGYLWQLYFYHE